MVRGTGVLSSPEALSAGAASLDGAGVLAELAGGALSDREAGAAGADEAEDGALDGAPPQAARDRANRAQQAPARIFFIISS